MTPGYRCPRRGDRDVAADALSSGCIRRTGTTGPDRSWYSKFQPEHVRQLHPDVPSRRSGRHAVGLCGCLFNRPAVRLRRPRAFHGSFWTSSLVACAPGPPNCVFCGKLKTCLYFGVCMTRAEAAAARAVRTWALRSCTRHHGVHEAGGPAEALRPGPSSWSVVGARQPCTLQPVQGGLCECGALLIRTGYG